MELADTLAGVNATLNACSLILLGAGYYFVRTRQLGRHKWAMLGAFGVSVAFLASYLTRVALSGTHVFPGTGAVRTLYLSMLASHVLLAAVVPFFALRGIFLGLRDRRVEHRRLMRVGLPIWAYVSVTGVLVYLMLYSALDRLPF